MRSPSRYAVVVGCLVVATAAHARAEDEAARMRNACERLLAGLDAGLALRVRGAVTGESQAERVAALEPAIEWRLDEIDVLAPRLGLGEVGRAAPAQLRKVWTRARALLRSPPHGARDECQREARALLELQTLAEALVIGVYADLEVGGLPPRVIAARELLDRQLRALRRALYAALVDVAPPEGVADGARQRLDEVKGLLPADVVARLTQAVEAAVAARDVDALDAAWAHADGARAGLREAR